MTLYNSASYSSGKRLHFLTDVFRLQRGSGRSRKCPSDRMASLTQKHISGLSITSRFGT